MQTTAYAAHEQGAALKPYTFERRELRGNDVAIEILYSGVCHSDLHVVRNDWGGARYPVVPGHEIVGRVIECEMIRMDQINEAYDRMERSDVRYRFVIDMATLQDVV